MVTDGLERAPARGMLRAVGMKDEDFAKPQIGIASSWNEITPCNLSLDRLAKASRQGVCGDNPLLIGIGYLKINFGTWDSDVYDGGIQNNHKLRDCQHK